MPRQATCHPDKPNRSHGSCSACYSRQRYKARRGQYLHYAITWRFKHKYGITIEDRQKLYDAQAGCCAICHIPEIKARRKCLAVDHCHTSGRVRGLLCDGCNQLLGNAKEQIDTLLQAVEYLKKGLI